MKIGDRDPTPPLAEFRAAYEEDDNWWWRIECGHHQNLFDEACEEIDRLREQLAGSATLPPSAVAGSSLRHVDLVSNDYGNGRQTCVGAIVDVGGELVIRSDNRETYRILAAAPQYPTLEAWAEAWGGGSYLMVTDPHTDSECPFAESLTIQFFPAPPLSTGPDGQPDEQAGS